jgi:hypothetical protein
MRKAKKFLSVFVTMLMIVSLLPTQAVHGFENLFTGRERSPHMVGDVAFGDVGNHGVVGDASISLLARYLLSTTPDAFLAATPSFDKRAASVKGDGAITTTDLTMLRAYIDGAIDYLGHIPGRLTIMPIDHLGEPVHEAEIEITINGESTTHTTETGVISQRNVPEGSTVSFSITSEAGTYEAEIESFCPDEHGIQVVTMGFDAPFIEVLTTFPDGRVTTSFIDIEYIATPSRGARIEAINYRIDGMHHGYLYIAENSTRYPHSLGMGTLGSARVFITWGDNPIEITAFDTYGKTATYVVENVPYLEWVQYVPFINEDAHETWEEFEYEPGQFLANHIYIDLADEFDGVDIIANLPAEIAEILDYLGGTISYHHARIPLLGIEMPINRTEAELRSLEAQLKQQFPNVVSRAWFSWGYFPDPHLCILSVGARCESCAGCFAYIDYWGAHEPTPTLTPQNENNEQEEGGGSASYPFRAEQPRNNYRDMQWGLDSINAPAAWDYFQKATGRQQLRNRASRIGIIDGAVYPTHWDLQIPDRNSKNTDGAMSTRLIDHGTAVMSVIGALHNGEGIDGTVNIVRQNLFSFGAHCIDGTPLSLLTQANQASSRAIADGLEWNVINGARVINASLANRNPDILGERMKELLEAGFCFVVVQGSGNGRNIPTEEFNTFITVEGQYRWRTREGTYEYRNLQDRIIVVGATAENGRLWAEHGTDGTSIGDRLDILAPGAGVRVAAYPNHSNRNRNIGEYFQTVNGTSFAAPHVAAVAAMLFELDPALEGPEVKDIILSTAHQPSVHPRQRWVFHYAHGDYFPRLDALAAVQEVKNRNTTQTDGRLVGRVMLANPADEDAVLLADVNVSIQMLRPYAWSSTTQTQAHPRGFFRFDNIPVHNAQSPPPHRDFNVHKLLFTADGFVDEPVHRLHIPSSGVTTLNIEMVPERPTSGVMAFYGNADDTYGGSVGAWIYAVDDLPETNLHFLRKPFGDEAIDGELYDGTVTLQFLRGIYLIDLEEMFDCRCCLPSELEDEVVKTMEITDGYFHAELPPELHSYRLRQQGLHLRSPRNIPLGQRRLLA